MFLAIFAVAVFVTITTQATLIPPEIVEFKSVNSNKLNLDEPNDVVSYGKGFKLVCKAKGSKPLKFQWKKDGVPIEQVHIWKNIRPIGSNGQTLQVKNPDPSADGKYQCFVSNAAGATFTRKMRVKVTYTSSFKESYKTVSKVNATLGRPLRLTCPSHSDGGQGNFGVNHFWVRKKLPYIKYLRPKQHRVILPNGDFLFLYLDQADINEIKLFPDKTVQCAVNAGRFIDYSKQYLIEATKTETADFGPEFKSPDHYPKSQEQAILGKRKEMFCVAVGKPAPKITWYRRKQDGQMTILEKINNGKEGFQLESFGRKLVINQVSKANEGYYQCTADNGVGKTVLPPPTKLNVAVAPKWISKPAKEVSVPINGQKSLMCEAVGTPPLTYNWYYNGTAFKSPDERKPHIVVQGNILKFTDMQQSNEGLFQCSVENDWGMLVSSSLVKAVKGSLTPPQIIQFSPFNSNKLNLDEAGDVINTKYGFKIVCKSSGSKPLKFQWKKDGINIENTQRIIYSKKAIDDNGEMLHVKYPDPSADGKYQCFVSNAAGATFTRKMRVKVTYATDFKEDENVVTKLKATVGKSLRLICPPHSDGRHGLFGAQHFWARKQRIRLSILSPSKNRVKLPNGDFLFLYLSQNDIDEIKLFPDKTVQCAVNAGKFIYYSKQYLIEATKTETADFGPEFQTPDDYPRSIENAFHGKSKKMLCAAVGKPAPNITWYRLNDDKTILKKIEHGKDGFVLQDYGRQLVINQASISQHEIGYYQCEASNGVGPSVKTPPTKLQVVAAPKWTTMPAKEVSVPINGKKTLLCEAVGTPPPIYNWYYNGTAFKSPDERKPHIVVQGNILKFTDMQQSNEGLFQCSVENDWGMLVSSSLVKAVKGSLTPPQIIQFSPFNSNKLNLDEAGDVINTKYGFKIVCKSSGSKPLKFQWKKDGINIENTQRIIYSKKAIDDNGEMLHVKYPDPSADGKYQCFVSNAAGATFTRKMRVKVTYATDFKEDKNVVTKLKATVGKSLRLICPPHSDGGHGLFGAQHFWARTQRIRLSILSPSKNRVKLPNGDFLFLYLSQNDIDEIKLFPDKTVQCAVNAGKFIDYSKQYLIEATKTETADFGPEFQTPDDYPRSIENAFHGKSKKMLCAAVGKPAPNITWYRLNDDKTILKKIEHGKDGFVLQDYGRQLVINQASISQHEIGYYQCEASNGAGPSVKTPPTKLQVVVAPKWTTMPAKEVSVPINGKKTLLCEAVGTPPLTYNWYYNGTAFKSPDERKPHIVVQGNGNILKITDMQQDNEGVFQCAVENAWGMLVSETWVKVN